MTNAKELCILKLTDDKTTLTQELIMSKKDAQALVDYIALKKGEEAITGTLKQLQDYILNNASFIRKDIMSLMSPREEG